MAGSRWGRGEGVRYDERVHHPDGGVGDANLHIQ